MTKPTELEAKVYELYNTGYQVFLESWHENRQIALDLMQQNLKPQGSTVTRNKITALCLLIIFGRQGE